MQYIPTADIKIDLTKAQSEIQQLILMVSLSQPNQYEFFKDLDLWMGESMAKIEEGVKKVNEENKESTNPEGQP
jgi:hypothetical protein